MYQLKKTAFLFSLFIYCTFSVKGQYSLTGSAKQDNCNCYTLTEPVADKAGGALNNQAVDLRKPFDFWFNVFLGCSDNNGADGIVFMLQADRTSIGRTGSGMGFANVAPSIGIALDTYQNIAPGDAINDLNDPAYDHISIQTNGNVRHGNDLAGPVPVSATSNNIEDCQWHTLRIAWNPDIKKLQAYFDGILRVETQTDLVKDIFGNNPIVYWGFNAATGGLSNLQRFCTALNPGFTTNITSDAACIGTAVSFTDQSVSFAPIAGYYWDMGDGATYTTASIASHVYQQPGSYEVKMAIKGLDGCTSDTLKKVITIASKPHAAFEVFDTCAGASPRLVLPPNTGVTYQWWANGVPLATREGLPQVDHLPAGPYALKTVVTSNYGCGTDEAEQSFVVKPTPVVQAQVRDACVQEPVNFNAVQTDNATEIRQWQWRFGNGQGTSVQNPIYTYNNSGTYPVQLWATATNGCNSDTIRATVSIAQAFAFAGNDTIVLSNTPFQLQGRGEGSVVWSPPTGLARTDVLNPTGVLTNDQVYELQVTTPTGCVAKDTVRVEVFKGSAIYVPTAFTPNGNGLNDLLQPRYTGISKLHYFTIYNRWGEAVFTTTDNRKGWDGKIKGKPAASGTYVWILSAGDISGKVYYLKGTLNLIR